MRPSLQSSALGHIVAGPCKLHCSKDLNISGGRGGQCLYMPAVCGTLQLLVSTQEIWPARYLDDGQCCAGTPQLQCLSIRTSVNGWKDANTLSMQGCGGFHNFVHVPQLRALDLEHLYFGQAAEFHLGMCLAKLVHLQASYLTALQGIEHVG